MARFDVFPNLNGEGYLLDVQADVLEGYKTRVVVPLLPEDNAPVPAKRLNPIVTINSKSYVMATQYIAAIPSAILKQKTTTLAEEDVAITNALDMLFFGF